MRTYINTYTHKYKLPIYIYIYIYIYIKNKTFIIRSYISVSSKPSKTQLFGRNRNITPDNKCLIFLYIFGHLTLTYKVYIYIYIYIYI